MVFPTIVAPAEISASTTGAEVDARFCALSQSGLPAPVATPAMSIRSLTANVRPDSSPGPDGNNLQRGPGTNAPKSMAADAGIETVPANVTLSCRRLAKRSNDRLRIGNKP